MLTYLSSFIKDFSSKLSVFRDFLKKDVDFILEAHYQNAFDSPKSEISESPLLNHYKQDQPVYLECDASLRGLDAALPQYDGNDQLRTGTTGYSIRNSMIPHISLQSQFSRRNRSQTTDQNCKQNSHISTTASSVHVHQASGYNFTIEHPPGKDNPLADGMSRLPNPNNKTTKDLDLRVDFVSFSTEKTSELQNETTIDST